RLIGGIEIGSLGDDRGTENHETQTDAHSQSTHDRLPFVEKEREADDGPSASALDAERRRKVKRNRSELLRAYEGLGNSRRVNGFCDVGRRNERCPNRQVVNRPVVVLFTTAVVDAVMADAVEQVIVADFAWSINQRLAGERIADESQ